MSTECLLFQKSRGGQFCPPLALSSLTDFFFPLKDCIFQLLSMPDCLTLKSIRKKSRLWRGVNTVRGQNKYPQTWLPQEVCCGALAVISSSQLFKFPHRKEKNSTQSSIDPYEGSLKGLQESKPSVVRRTGLQRPDGFPCQDSGAQFCLFKLWFPPCNPLKSP